MKRLRLRLPLPPRRGGLAVAGVTVLALAGGLVLAGVHDTYPRTRLVESSGLAWVSSDRIGALTLLDGVAGQPVADVSVARADGDPLLAAQNGGTGFALDQTSGQLTRVDGSTYATLPAAGPPAVGGSGRGTAPATELFVGTDTTYVVDGAEATVSAYDTSTLHAAGAARTFAGTAASYTAVLDATGRLWVLDQAAGRLDWFTATARGQAAEAFPHNAGQLTLADGEPVVVDSEAGSATLISPDGSAGDRIGLGASGHGAAGSSSGADISVTGSSTRPGLLITDSADGTYQSCDLDLDTCDTPEHAAFDGDRLGPAVTALGRVFVPDYSTGTAWVLDPGGAAGAVETGPLTAVGPFDLFSRAGLVFYNDPDDAQAGTLQADGTAKPILKYSAATATGSSATAAASGNATGTAAAASGPAASAPTTAPTLSPSRPSASGAGQGGTPSPRPDPTGTGGTPSCSSAPAPSVYDQEGNLMGDSDQSPPPDKEKRPGWGPDSKAVVIAAVIGGFFTLAGVLIPLYITSHESSSAPPQPSTTAVAATGTHASGASSAAPPTSAANFPKAPRYTQQDPGGAGVYGVVFTSGGTFATGDLNGSSYLWTLDSDQSTARLSDQSGQAIFGLAYDPGRNLLAADTFAVPHYDTGSVVLWKTAATTGTYVSTLKNSGTEGVGSPPAFSPDGKTLASSDANGGIYLWNVANNGYTPAGTLPDQSSEPNYEIAFNPADGTMLAAGNGDGVTYLWNTQTKQVTNTLPDPDGKAVGPVAFSLDGSTLATGDAAGNVYLWNARSGAREVELPGLAGGSVQSIAFSPRTGIVAATINNDSTKTYEFCIWNTQGKLLAQRVDPGSIGATKLAFSPDGTDLVVGDENDSAYIWQVSGIG